jgi:hypothetical protein
MVFATPEIIKQAVAGSHVAVWRQPVYTQNLFGMLGFTLLTGFLGLHGLHHVMLRSPLTALLFFLFNSATWGYWLLFDILQIAYTEVDDLNTYGLGSPFLFEFGIAVGMWKDETRIYSTQEAPAGAAAAAGAAANAAAFSKSANAGGKGAGGAANAGNNPAPAGAAAAANTANNPAPVAPKEVQQGGYQQRGGGSAKVAPAPAAAAADAAPEASSTKSPSLAQRFGSFIKLLFTMILGLFNTRPPEIPMLPDETKVIGDPPTHAFWVFLFILFAPIGVVASMIAGDNMSALLHVFDPLMILTFFLNTMSILFNPLEIFMGGVYRPLLYRALNTPFEIRGQSGYLQMGKRVPVDEIGSLVENFTRIFTELAGAFEELGSLVPAAGLGKLANSAGKIGNAATMNAAANAEKTQAEAALLRAQAAQLTKGTPTVAVKAAPGPEGKPALKPQRGGFVERGSRDSDTISLGVLGAVLLGGLLLGVVRSNVFQGKDDSPPVARTVRGPKGF